MLSKLLDGKQYIEVRREFSLTYMSVLEYTHICQDLTLRSIVYIAWFNNKRRIISMVMEKRMDFFERYLSVWVGLCIFIGIGFGKLFPGVVEALSQM